MPARKIPRSYRNVTGRVAHGGTSAHFESPLERDFYRLLRFDSDVQSIHVQPLQIPFVRADGSSGYCYPDALVIFHPLSGRRTTLYEVKERAKLRQAWGEFKPKLKAARKRATLEGWKFKIVTEKEIRTPLLDNADFLLDYKDREVDHLKCQRILRVLREIDGWTVNKLLDSMESELRTPRLELIPIVWHLVATKQAQVDLQVPLSGKSPISARSVPR
ncbi:MAG TPA: heteromeric transposase endonuclease subunit TnsA [Solimonas sp.]